MSGGKLSFDGLSAGYNQAIVLKDVEGEICPSDRIALIGPNASGKSTFLRVLAGFLQSSGTIRFGQKDIGRFLPEHRAQLGIAYLRQTHNVFPTLTAQENLEVAHRRSGGVVFASQRDWLLSAFPILRKNLGKIAGWLSTGERQILALSMVLINSPKVLLLDEPLAGLSEGAAANVMETLNSAQEEFGFGYALVEHRFSLVRDFVQQVWVMNAGEIVERTSDAGILSDETRLAEHFLST